MRASRVLIVDDDTSVLQVLSQATSPLAEVECAINAEQALGLLATRAYDVLITDESMPGLSGTELLLQAKQQCPTLVTVLITGNRDLDIAARALNETGISKFLGKPFSMRDFLPVLEDSLRQARQRQAESAIIEAASQQSRALRQLEASSGQAQTGARRLPAGAVALLSVTQRRVAELLIAGNDTKRIAAELGISPNTVRNHVRAVYGKLNVHSRAELMNLALPQ